MAKIINASLEDMENTISAVGGYINDLNSSTSDFESQIRSLSGRDWNEETGASINSNLEAATSNIRKLIEQLSGFQDALNKIKASYAEELAAYRNQKM